MFKISKLLTNCLKNGNRQSVIGRFNNFSASVAVTEAKSGVENGTEEVAVRAKGVKPKNNMVAAAFASLHLGGNEKGVLTTPQTDSKISQAQTVDELLAISEGSGVSRRHALKVVSILAEWSSSGKINLADFETDGRFIKLCRILTRGGTYKARNNNTMQNEDLSTILNVTADDEAAKLVANITLPQKVKVMSTLALRKRRSTSLLRALAYNLTATSEKLDIKQCADVLYSMCILNYSEDNLLTKISTDICQALQGDIQKSSVVGSIITSLGLLKYKNPELLDGLSDWILKNQSICRSQDIFSLFVTLGALHYVPENADNIFTQLLPQLSINDVRKPIVWLDLIWSLVLLDRATHQQVSDVLDDNFTTKLLEHRSANVSTNLKLLNINGAAEYLLKDYKGSRLSNDSKIYDVETKRSKDKSEIIAGVVDTLKNLINPDNIKDNIQTDLGFSIDAKILLDKKCQSLPFDGSNENRTDIAKIAIMVHDFHDMCRGKLEPAGVSMFAKKLLEAQGYKIIEVPYTEFRVKDKLIHRVQYLETKLKETVERL